MFSLSNKVAYLTLQINTFLLVLMFVYAAMSKLLSFEDFRSSMGNQMFPQLVQIGLIYTLPAIELLTACLMLFKRTMLAGHIFYVVLMSLFTAYIAAALLHFFKEVPCSCGGILSRLGWLPHLYFNLIFLCIALINIIIIKQKGAAVTIKKN